MAKKEIAATGMKEAMLDRQKLEGQLVSLNDLQLAAKESWREGSLYEEAAEAERTGKLQSESDLLSKNIARILSHSVWSSRLPYDYGIRSIDSWSFREEYEVEDEEDEDDLELYSISDEDWGTEARISLHDVPTADAGTVRVAIYEDDYRSSIDRVAADATLETACQMWTDRWAGDVPDWVANIVSVPDTTL